MNKGCGLRIQILPKKAGFPRMGHSDYFSLLITFRQLEHSTSPQPIWPQKPGAIFSIPGSPYQVIPSGREDWCSFLWKWFCHPRKPRGGFMAAQPEPWTVQLARVPSQQPAKPGTLSWSESRASLSSSFPLAHQSLCHFVVVTYSHWP